MKNLLKCQGMMIIQQEILEYFSYQNYYKLFENQIQIFLSKIVSHQKEDNDDETMFFIAEKL